MGILCDWQITNEIEDNEIIIEPFDMAQLNPNSYDVRLGNWFVDVSWEFWMYPENAKEGQIRQPLFSEPYYIKDGKEVFIPVGGTLLGMTKEVVGTRNHTVAEIRAKSSTRRVGITICDDAGFGDIGYINHWTVELTAHSFRGKSGDQYRITVGNPLLIVGEPFAQMVFFESRTPNKKYAGQYSENDWPACMIPKKYRIKGD